MFTASNIYDKITALLELIYTTSPLTVYHLQTVTPHKLCTNLLPIEIEVLLPTHLCDIILLIYIFYSSFTLAPSKNC